MSNSSSVLRELQHKGDRESASLSCCVNMFLLAQVRLAASVATRQFLQTLPNSESRERFYPKILPAMCLNRLDIT